ncbi:MAG: ABC transporter permease subunit [Trueperaceae bacterium]|nr:MAG: ABC transporter permease subunit [Trueperaceae bacterium]
MKPVGIKPVGGALIGTVLCLIALTVRFSTVEVGTTFSVFGMIALTLSILAGICAVVGHIWTATLLAPIGLIGASLPVLNLEGTGAVGYWMTFWGFLLITLAGIGRISMAPMTTKWQKRLGAYLPPTVVPLILLLLWQALVVGFEVPKGIFPSVTDVYAVLTSSYAVLLTDSYVTFVKEVVFGFILGLVGGFLFGLMIAYSTFLQRGFLPLAAAFGAVPIVGLAPVLGRAFGVDWESKAVVVIIVTFFPVVLNTVIGLTLVDTLKLELLKVYAAGPLAVLWHLRLPNALPFLFNALKLAAVVSVISVIVAEFLIPGPPPGTWTTHQPLCAPRCLRRRICSHFCFEPHIDRLLRAVGCTRASIDKLAPIVSRGEL